MGLRVPARQPARRPAQIAGISLVLATALTVALMGVVLAGGPGGLPGAARVVWDATQVPVAAIAQTGTMVAGLVDTLGLPSASAGSAKPGGGAPVQAGLAASSGIGGAGMRFGVGQSSLEEAQARGIAPDYAQIWAGVWNEDAGWDAIGRWAGRDADLGVVPVVEWWYWGDDISRACIVEGCRSDGHWKDAAHWRADAERLADTLHENLQGRQGVLVLETEFNKNDVRASETLDHALASHARIFRERAPELVLVLGFGAWGSDDWHKFDRAAAAVDLMGLQVLRGATRDGLDRYLDTAADVAAWARKMHEAFGKPVLIHDIALSSYPGPAWEAPQAKVVEGIFQRLPDLQHAGVEGLVYRALPDRAGGHEDDYYGAAELAWGLRRVDGTPKAALGAWIDGVHAAKHTERTGAPGATLGAVLRPASRGST